MTCQAVSEWLNQRETIIKFTNHCLTRHFVDDFVNVFMWLYHSSFIDTIKSSSKNRHEFHTGNGRFQLYDRFV